MSVLKRSLFTLLILVIAVQSLFGQTKAMIDTVNNMSYNEMIGNLEINKEKLIQNINNAKAINYKEGEAIANQKLAIVYFYLRDMENGLKCNIEAVKYYESQNDYTNIANTYSDLGFSIKEINLDKSLEYFRKALAIDRIHDLGLTSAKLFNNYGTLMKMKDQLDSALFYHYKSLEVAEKFKDSIGIPYSLNNIVTVLSTMGRYEEALEILDQSDAYRILENNELSWADNLAYRADVYFDKKDYDSAIVYYLKALELSKKTNFMNLISFSLERLSISYENQKDATNALKYYKELKLHKDSIISVETNKAIASIQTAFEVAKKEQKIAEQELQLANERNRFYVGIGFAFIILIFALWIYFYQIKKRRYELERLKNEEQLEKIRREKEFVEEKLRIGRELHDNIGSQLTFMISSVDNLVYVEKEDATKQKLNRISDFGRTTMKELRSTIWAMKNDGGNLNDLILKVNELKLALPNTLDVVVLDETKENIQLNALLLLNLYRIIQEALQNIVKYADASDVKIIFSSKESKLILQIVDNGKGFEMNDSKDGNGLINMQRRCEESGGLFTLKSSKMGTHILCEIGMNT